MSNNCKCPFASNCNSKRGYFDCAKKLIKFVENLNIDNTRHTTAIRMLCSRCGVGEAVEGDLCQSCYNDRFR